MKKRVGKSGHTLYIKNPAAHRLARQISQTTGVTLSDAVIGALEDKVRKLRRPLDYAKLDAIRAQVAALPVVDARSADEILDYDELGLPR